MLIHVAETPDLRRTRKKVTSLVLRAGNLNFLAVSVPKGGLTSLPCGNPLRPGGLGFLSVRLCARLLMSLFHAAVDQRYSHWANNNLG